MIYYWFDWGDDSTSGWIGPYSSGETVEVSHKWTKAGEYLIHVKAMDVYGREGEWSDPLEVTMSRNRAYSNTLLLRLLERFSFLERLFNLIL